MSWSVFPWTAQSLSISSNKCLLLTVASSASIKPWHVLHGGGGRSVLYPLVSSGERSLFASLCSWDSSASGHRTGVTQRAGSSVIVSALRRLTLSVRPRVVQWHHLSHFNSLANSLLCPGHKSFHTSPRFSPLSHLGSSDASKDTRLC